MNNVLFFSWIFILCLFGDKRVYLASFCHFLIWVLLSFCYLAEVEGVISDFFLLILGIKVFIRLVFAIFSSGSCLVFGKKKT